MIGVTSRARQRLFLSLAVALIGFLQIGVAAAADLPVWRHGIVAPKADAGFVFMAAKGGFAEKQGLHIDLVPFSGDALALKAFLAGDLDSYEGNPGSPILAAAHGADVRLVGCYWPGLTYALFSKPAVTLSTLAGKSFAISSPGALPDLLARAVLEQHGVAAGAVRFVVMGSDADRFKALLTGVTDVAAASIEFAPVAATDKLKLLVSAHDAVPNYLRFCLYMNRHTIADRRDEAIRFLAAESAGLSYALDHRAATIALTHATIHDAADDPRPGYIFDTVAREKAIDPTLGIPMARLAWMQALLVKTGNLDHVYDLSKLVDPSLRGPAVERAGK